MTIFVAAALLIHSLIYSSQGAHSIDGVTGLIEKGYVILWSVCLTGYVYRIGYPRYRISSILL